MANIPQLTCIYKITSPSGKVYIGQTINARRRYLDYCSKLAVKQPALRNSIKKYGWISHKFEIIHILPNDVTQDVLNAYECLYMELYKECGITLLNVKEGGSNGRNSPESIRIANDKWKSWYKNNPELGRKWIEKSVESRKGVELSKEHRQKLSNQLKGRKFSAEHIANLSNSTKGKSKNISDNLRKELKERALSIAGKNKIPVHQFSLNGEFIKEWSSGTEAANNLNLTRKGIEACLKKRKGGKTCGGFIWRYSHDNTIIDLKLLSAQ